MFIITTTYTASVFGSVIKCVECEACRESYTYQMNREAEGREMALFFMFMSRAEKRSAEYARKNLEKKLDTEHDDVPCPECGHHQAQMIASIRGVSYLGMKNLGEAFFIFAAVVLGVMLALLLVRVLGSNPSMPNPSTMGYCAITVLAVAAPGLILRGLRSLLLLAYNPNR